MDLVSVCFSGVPSLEFAVNWLFINPSVFLGLIPPVCGSMEMLLSHPHFLRGMGLFLVLYHFTGE